jgi:hypothetical protein
MMSPEPQAQGDIPSPVQRKRSTRRIVSIAFACFVGSFLGFKVDCFICGLLGYAPLTHFFMCESPIRLLALFLILGLVLQIGFRWRGRWSWFVAFAMVWLYFFPLPVFPGASHAWGFSFWARRNIDIQAAVRWAEQFQLPPLAGSQSTTIPVKPVESFRIPYSWLPAEIRSVVRPDLLKADKYLFAHYPQMGPWAVYSRVPKTLDLWYGSGAMGHWGVTMGRKCAIMVPDYMHKIKISDDAYVTWVHPHPSVGAGEGGDGST